MRKIIRFEGFVYLGKVFARSGVGGGEMTLLHPSWYPVRGEGRGQ